MITEFLTREQLQVNEFYVGEGPGCKIVFKFGGSLEKEVNQIITLIGDYHSNTTCCTGITKFRKAIWEEQAHLEACIKANKRVLAPILSLEPDNYSIY